MYQQINVETAKHLWTESYYPDHILNKLCSEDTQIKLISSVPPALLSVSDRVSSAEAQLRTKV